MNRETIHVKRALISVSNKAGIVEFAKGLHALNVEILSTGGTSKLLREASIPVRDVADVTGFPEMMDGRVKTLHPRVHGGILGLRDEHADIAKLHDIVWIDLVVVNLYPFSETIAMPNVAFDDAIENIDIGGPAMIRSAAKNMGWVSVVVDHQDYAVVLKELNTGLTYATRAALAAKAFAHTAHYDHIIQMYLSLQQQAVAFPDIKTLRFQKYGELRYGENPHQKASAYQFAEYHEGILSAKQHQGKPLSYNNIGDADAAVACVNEFAKPAAVIVKHANSCGVAMADTIQEAFHKAYEADALSAFGGVVALNRACDEATAEQIAKNFFEVIIAPTYTSKALEILSAKSNLRVLELSARTAISHEYKFIQGGFLLQESDKHILQTNDLKVVTQCSPSASDIETMLFAWPVLKQLKSNAILIAKNNVTVGVGVGQVSRVDAVDIAIKKAGDNLHGTVLASDAFFPFRDSIDRMAGKGIAAIIQPGGSMRDEEVIAACNEHRIAMVFTGMRCFKH